MDKFDGDILFTSDLHFYHRRVLDFCSESRKGITDVDEMNAALIETWNQQVKKSDIVFHLGDFSFGSIDKTAEILAQLKGQKHFLMGNHDKGIIDNPKCRKYLTDLKDYKEIKVRDTKICMFHFPMWEWYNCHKGSFHLFGHVHETYSTVRGKSLNVGIDGRPNKDFKFWHLDEVFEYMQDKPVITHHNKTDVT